MEKAGQEKKQDEKKQQKLIDSVPTPAVPVLPRLK